MSGTFQIEGREFVVARAEGWLQRWLHEGREARIGTVRELNAQRRLLPVGRDRMIVLRALELIEAAAWNGAKRAA